MSSYRENLFAIPESVHREEYVIGTYTVHVEVPNYMTYAGMLAVQESTGSWVPLPLETQELVARHGALVTSAFEVPDYEYDRPEGKRSFIVQIAFPIVNFGHQIPMLLNTVIGVISYFGDIKLVELDFPESYVKRFPGPRFGVKKMREYTTVDTGPLCGCILKPATGLTPGQAGKQFYEAALGGANLIKDDEKTANASYSLVGDRVRACMKAERAVFEETGRHTLYAVNVTDTPDRLLDNARAAIDAGGNMLMLSHLTAGMGMVQVLAESEDIDVPIQVHADLLGGVSRSPRWGMSSHLSLGKLPRLCGADVACVAVSYVPTMQEKIGKLLVAMQSPFYGLKRSWVLAGGGVHPGMAREIIDHMGRDIILCAGGGIHAHPTGTRAGAAALRQAIDAVLVDRDLYDAAGEHEELRVALDTWGNSEASTKDGG
jgi:2,3-diketo-5-methylthiopentyl-1-phosphate enolase